MNSRNSGDILRTAAMRIAQPGAWLKFSLCEKKGCDHTWKDLPTGDAWCVTGAIYAETGHRWPLYPDNVQEVRLVCEVLSLDVPKLINGRNSYHRALVDWNNDFDRTQDEVVAALLLAAEMWEAQQIVEELQEV